MPRAGRRPWRRLLRYRPAVIGLVCFAQLVAASVAVPALGIGGEANAQNLARSLEEPSWPHPLGFDHLGRDILNRTMRAARVSWTIAGAAVLLGLMVGVPMGILAGTLGGVTDTLIMRVTDVLLAFPFILLAILIVTVIGSGVVNTTLAIAIPMVPVYARLARGSSLQLSQLSFVEAARAQGASVLRIVGRHVLPNSWTPLIVQATYSFALAILYAGGLSFLGLGVSPPTPELGVMLNEGRQSMLVSPHVVIGPGLMISLTVIVGNLVGDGLRLALDPRGVQQSGS